MNNPKILLVDDDEITNFMSKQMLSEIGIEAIDSAINGREALKYLEQACPDLIFLDIKMPVMDGFELLAELEENSLCQQAKIVMLTSSSRESEKQQASSYKNVIDFIVKPLTKGKVGEVLQRV